MHASRFEYHILNSWTVFSTSLFCILGTGRMNFGTSLQPTTYVLPLVWQIFYLTCSKTRYWCSSRPWLLNCQVEDWHSANVRFRLPDTSRDVGVFEREGILYIYISAFRIPYQTEESLQFSTQASLDFPHAAVTGVTNPPADELCTWLEECYFFLS